MYPDKLLRKQVDSELKRRRYIIITFLLLSIIYVMTTIVFGERGLLRYIDLREKEASLRVEVDKKRKDNDKLKALIDTYDENSYYLEKHARENFGLAEPDEYIYRYEQ